MLQLQLVLAKSILFYIISSENGTEWTVGFTGIFCSIYKHHPRLVRQIHFWGKTCSNVRRQTDVTPAVTWPKQKQSTRGMGGKDDRNRNRSAVSSGFLSLFFPTMHDDRSQTRQQTPTVNIWTSSQNASPQSARISDTSFCCSLWNIFHIFHL